MRSKLLVWALFVMMVAWMGGATSTVRADDVEEQELIESLLERSEQLLQKMIEEPDAQNMAVLMQRAHGVAIFPSVIKVGFGIGGLMGDGLLMERDAVGNWHGPGFMDIRGLSYGWQAGFQSIGMVLIITSEEGMDSFRSGNIKVGGDASFAIGPWGRSGEISTDLELESAIYGYSIAQGAFLGISFSGSDIRVVPSLNEAYWGEFESSRTLFEQPANDPRVLPLVEALKQFMDVHVN